MRPKAYNVDPDRLRELAALLEAVMPNRHTRPRLAAQTAGRRVLAAAWLTGRLTDCVSCTVRDLGISRAAFYKAASDIADRLGKVP